MPSDYALAARNSGLEIITWTLERSGSLAEGGGFYCQTLNGDISRDPAAPEPGIINRDSQMLELLHVLAQDVGVAGVFSDWPATVTYFANCMGLD